MAGSNPEGVIDEAGEPQQYLGKFSAGAVPPTIEHTYLDFQDAIVDLTGFTTLSVQITASAGVTATLGTGTVQNKSADPTNGTLEYLWGSDDMRDPGFYRLQMWASNGVNKLESDVFVYEVYDGPGSAP